MKSTSSTTHKPGNTHKAKAVLNANRSELLKWYVGIAVLTGICLSPILSNEFTNWDDDFNIINNPLLRGPDWPGIFSESVTGNYHPLTIISLAFNYAISGLDPFSYFMVNYLLHIVNTMLVFYFIWKISAGKLAVAAFTAIIFGIHPMHVESVAWISERKDVMYTLFFLLALIQYWQYLISAKRKHFWLCFLFFILALLSKPAAVILPLVLLLLDYWNGRRFNSRAFTEKIPFFLLSFIMGVVTIKIQSPTAIAGLETFSITSRLLFACYTLMIYFIRFFIPYPLSAFHPFPAEANLGLPVMLSPLFIIALVSFLWYQRKNKIIVFGFLFFIVNLLLVLQVLSIGLTIVSERYTYVPYIGLAFMAAMVVTQIKMLSGKVVGIVAAVFVIALGAITFQRTKIWKNSGTLWTDVVDRYPETPYPRTNRANYLSILAGQKNPQQRDSLLKVALEDCNIALRTNPRLAAGYEKRGLVYVELKMYKEALADGDSLVKYDPQNKIGYDIRGTVWVQFNQPAKAMENYDQCIAINPADHRSYNNRGTIYLNYFQKPNEALAEFNKAIEINPLGNYLLNRAICYYRLGNLNQARNDANAAAAKGATIPQALKTALQMN